MTDQHKYKGQRQPRKDMHTALGHTPLGKFWTWTTRFTRFFFNSGVVTLTREQGIQMSPERLSPRGVPGRREVRGWEERERERGEDRAGESNSPLTVSLTFWSATATRDEQGGGRETEERDRQREISDVPLGSIFRIIYALVFLLHSWRWSVLLTRLDLAVGVLIVTHTHTHWRHAVFTHKHTFLQKKTHQNTSKTHTAAAHPGAPKCEPLTSCFVTLEDSFSSGVSD